MSLLESRKLIKDQELKEGAEWIICGFLRVFKQVGKLNFAILSDSSAKIQVLFKEGLDCKKESVLLIKGTLVKRKSPNPNVELGEWEVIVEEYQIISEALKLLPFELIDAADEASEPTRLKYRYLDLRRNNCQNLVKKSQIMNSFRETLISNSFTEVNTPVLSVSSKEGANTFDTYVEKDGKKAKFSLAQSPQLYKQLLMISGLEKYFQFANCFRLEDLRSDRQYEFLQLDIEIAYSNQEKFFSLIETCFKEMMKKVFNYSLEIPFKRITYKDALEKYGSDKPDLRYGLELEKLDLPDLAKENNHNEVFGFYLPCSSVHVVETKWLKSLQTKNTIYIVHVLNGKVTKVHLMDKDMNEYRGEGVKEEQLISNHIDKYPGVWILTTVCPKTKKNALTSLGNLRFHFSRRPKGEIKEDLNFVWVTDWPLFEWNETQNEWTIAHHLFTRPLSNSTSFNKETEQSLGYDLVLNGVELASGSQRNYLLDVQKYMFKLAELSEQEIEENFGWFLEALNYGVPPHMGIAIGIDRLAQILLKTTTIRDVIAFPKNNSGVCPLTNSPVEIEE